MTAIRGRADTACRDVCGAGMSHLQRGRRRDGGCLLSWRGSTLSVVGLGRTSGSLRGVGVDPRHWSAAVADGHVFVLARRRSARQPGHGGACELRTRGPVLAWWDASSTRRYEISIWRGTSAMAVWHLRQRRQLAAFRANHLSGRKPWPKRYRLRTGARCFHFNPRDLL